MAEDSKIRIPIEIETEESQDIKNLIEELKKVEHIPEEAEKKQTAKKKKFVSESGAPIKTNYTEDEFGIFAGEQEGNLLPDIGRDRKSKQAVNNQNQFKKVQKDVDDIKNLLAGKGGTQLGYVTKATQFFVNPGNALAGIFMEFAPIIGTAMVASGVAETMIDQLTRPGGLLDIRFKRDIHDEVDPLLERNTKAEIAAGLRDVRVTSYAGERQKAAGQVVTTQQFMKAGRPVYSSDLENIAKGVLS